MDVYHVGYANKEADLLIGIHIYTRKDTHRWKSNNVSKIYSLSHDITSRLNCTTLACKVGLAKTNGCLLEDLTAVLIRGT